MYSLKRLACVTPCRDPQSIRETFGETSRKVGALSLPRFHDVISEPESEDGSEPRQPHGSLDRYVESDDEIESNDHVNLNESLLPADVESVLCKTTEQGDLHAVKEWLQRTTRCETTYYKM